MIVFVFVPVRMTSLTMKNLKGKITLTVYSSEKSIHFSIGLEKKMHQKLDHLSKKVGLLTFLSKQKYLLVMCDMDLYSMIVS